MSQVDQYKARLRKSREQVVDLGDGLKVTFERPPWEDFAQILGLTRNSDGDQSIDWGRIGVAEAKKYVTGWSGFSEATLFGPTVGASDISVPFDRELWSMLVADNLEWSSKVATAIVNAMVDFLVKRGDVAKNSEPASTPTPESKASSSSPETPTTSPSSAGTS